MSEITPKYIRLTRNVVSEMFDECNRLYFNNTVERPLKLRHGHPIRRLLEWCDLYGQQIGIRFVQFSAYQDDTDGQLITSARWLYMR